MTTLRPFLAGGALLIGTALFLPASAQQDGPSLDGKWAGRTSQGKPIAFRVEAGAMDVLELDWIMHLDGVCPGLTGSAPSLEIARGDMFFFHKNVRGYEPPAVLFPTFAVSRDVEATPVPVTVKVTGSFGSDGTVSGEMTLTATGCSGHETVTWQAKKKAERDQR